MLSDLISAAEQSPRKRQHLNIHQSYSDPSQRLFNAISAASYIPPHRHAGDFAAEDLFAIDGQLALVVFDSTGAIDSVTLLAAGARADGIACGAEVAPNTWHTVLALTESAVLLEMKAGPFDPGAAKFLAPWAPVEGSAEAASYLAAMRRHVLERLDIPAVQVTGVGATC